MRNENLYFSVTRPHLIVGTVGNGKGLAFVRENIGTHGVDVTPFKIPGLEYCFLAAKKRIERKNSVALFFDDFVLLRG